MNSKNKKENRDGGYWVTEEENIVIRRDAKKLGDKLIKIFKAMILLRNLGGKHGN